MADKNVRGPVTKSPSPAVNKNATNGKSSVKSKVAPPNRPTGPRTASANTGAKSSGVSGNKGGVHDGYLDAAKHDHFSPLSIGGIRSGALQSKIAKGFVIVAGVVMAASFAMTSLYNASTGSNNGQGLSPTETAATVGAKTVTEGQLMRSFEQEVEESENFGEKITPSQYLDRLQGSLKEATDRYAVIDAAEKAGVNPTDAEIDKKIQSYIDDQLKPDTGQSAAAKRRMIEHQYGSMDAAREKMAGDYDRQLVKDQLEFDDYQKQLQDADVVTENDYKLSVTKLKLWDIVIRPALPATNSKDFQASEDQAGQAAQAKATKLVAQLKANPTLANFQNAVVASSDDIAGKAKKGDLGWKLPSDITYAPGMGDALSKSADNIVGPLADTTGAQYIFFIEARNTVLPKDYAKNKAKLIKDLKTSRDDDIWQKKQDEIKKAVTPVILDPALAAYQIQQDQLKTATGDTQKQLRQTAINDYNQALRNAPPEEHAAIDLQISQLYGQSGDPADKPAMVAALADAVKEVPDDPSILLAYARGLRAVGNTSLAVNELKIASTDLAQNPSPPSPFGGANPDDQTHQDIATEFDVDNQPKLAAAERAKVKPAAAPGGPGGTGSAMNPISLNGPNSPIKVTPG